MDSSKQSIEVLGELLPSLQQLVLENSTLFSFRDLGTSLHSLRTLSLSRSSITDLDGISSLTCLQELYVQHNQITDISPLSMHEELQVVGEYHGVVSYCYDWSMTAHIGVLSFPDLEGNSISDIRQVEQLGKSVFPLRD